MVSQFLSWESLTKFKINSSLLSNSSYKLTSVRLRRLELEKDDAPKKAAQLAPLWEAHWQRCQTLTSPPEKFLELRWRLEELRVSLFAQELKTAYPVSVQKLQNCLVNG